MLLAAGSVERAFSQDSLSTPSWAWVGFAYGSTRGVDFSGLLLGQSVSYLKNNQIYSARFLIIGKKSTTTGFAVPFNSSVGRLTNMFEASALYGFALKNRIMLFSVSTGLGYVQLTRASEPSISSVVIPLDIQMSVTPIRMIGFGIFFFANLHSKTAYNGAMFCIHIGVV